MRFVVDADMHIHSKVSLCSNDDEQTNERILRYAVDNGLKTVVLTDHFWDRSVPCESDWYAKQDLEHLKKAKPLPQAEGVRFLFGCETELDRNCTLAISKESFDEFDFIIIPTTHFHMKGLVLDWNEVDTEGRAKAWLRRLESVLSMDLPFHKVGLAHLTCSLVGEDKPHSREVIKSLPEDKLYELFKKAAEVGVGIELNYYDMGFEPADAETVLRIYRIAKECGCKFYFGSDAHHPAGLENTKERYERIVDMLGLTEDDKFVL